MKHYLSIDFYSFLFVFLVLVIGNGSNLSAKHDLNDLVTEIKVGIQKNNQTYCDSIFKIIDKNYDQNDLENNIYYLIQKAFYFFEFHQDYQSTLAITTKAENLILNSGEEDLDILYSLNRNYGKAYDRLNQSDKVIEYREKNLQIAIEKNDSLLYAKTQVNLSGNYYEIDELEKAIDYAKSAMNYFQQKKLNFPISIASNMLCMMYTDKYKSEKQTLFLDSAQHYLNKFKLSLDKEDEESIFTYYLNQAHLDKAYTNYELAFNRLDSSKNHISEFNQSDWRLVYDLELDLYEKTGQYDQLKKAARNHYNFVDSTYNVKINKELDELRFALEQECILREEKQTEEQAAQNAESNLYLSLAVGTLLGISLLSSLLYQRYIKRKNEAELSSLEQQLLRTQMNPHFMFNTLANIKALISQEENKTAGKYLNKFSNLLRISLDNSTENAVALDKEIKAIELYLELQKIRFNNTFDYELNVQIEHIEDHIIPTMLIQPFVENCFKHAFKGINYKGLIKINILKKDKVLICFIEDNGVGLQNKSTTSNSLSYKITNRRLELIQKQFDTSGHLTLQNNKDEQGVTVIIEIPYRYE